MSTTDPVGGRGGAPPAVAAGRAAVPGPGSLPERVAGALLAHPDVVRLSGGTFGSLATYLPGRRLIGVALGDGTGPVRIGVVLRLGAPVRATAEVLRRLVAAETGAGRVDVVVADVEPVGAGTAGTGTEVPAP